MKSAHWSKPFSGQLFIVFAQIFKKLERWLCFQTEKYENIPVRKTFESYLCPQRRLTSVTSRRACFLGVTLTSSSLPDGAAEDARQLPRSVTDDEHRAHAAKTRTRLRMWVDLPRFAARIFTTKVYMSRLYYGLLKALAIYLYSSNSWCTKRICSKQQAAAAESRRSCIVRRAYTYVDYTHST